MNNTAVSAMVQSIKDHKELVAYSDQSYDRIHMVFANEEQEQFYYEKLKQVLYQDNYHKALLRFLSIWKDAMNYFSQSYDSKTRYIKTKYLQEGRLCYLKYGCR